MRRIFFYINRGLFGLSCVLVVTGLVVLVLKLLMSKESAQPAYWIAYSSDVDNLTFSVFCLGTLLIWGLFPILAVLSYIFKDIKPYVNWGGKAIFVSMIAGILFFASYLVDFFHTGPLGAWKPSGDVSVNGRNYHLVFHAGDYAEQHTWNYYLYECNSLDMFCQQLTSIAHNGMDSEVETIRLLSDTAANTVSVEVNGAVTYTHRGE